MNNLLVCPYIVKPGQEFPKFPVAPEIIPYSHGLLTTK